jgi:hypothetical protein
MANQWALIIGINQYRALQPLMYAQEDARAIRNLFVDQLGISIHNCTLITDISTSLEPHAYAPVKAVIEEQLQILCRDNVQPNDLLWVFFSGCGLVENDKDYWMTVDADPMQAATTAIALSTVFDILKTARTNQIVLAMDMNRSRGAIGNRNIGTETIKLAQTHGIPTFLSCQPDEYAHETLHIRQGIFTKALIEGLRDQGCVTVAQLQSYLATRVPELCVHYARPPQTPVAVIPPAHKFMMVLPQLGIGPATDFAPISSVASGVPSDSEIDVPPYAVGVTQAPVPTSVPPMGVPLPTEQVNMTGEMTLPFPSDSPPNTTLVPKPEPDSEEAVPPLSAVWKWGGILATLAFLSGVLLQYRQVLIRGASTAERPETPGNVSPSPSAPAPPSSNQNQPPAAVSNTAPTAPSNSAPSPTSTLPTGETALQRAESAIAANRFGEAQAWLEQMPPELQNERYQELLRQTNSEVASAALRNQEILNNARKIIQPNSASAFNDAIEQARQVPPEDPYHEQAQADIARWSGVILDLAEGRAVSGDLNGAIAAARLVPTDQGSISDLAQQRIATWERQITNQNLIQQAQNSLQPGQASSFNDAIRALEQITPDQPGYDTARAKVEQWSQDILAIARSRAAQNDLNGAIAAALLVPPQTQANAPAQEELRRWQGQ